VQLLAVEVEAGCLPLVRSNLVADVSTERRMVPPLIVAVCAGWDLFQLAGEIFSTATATPKLALLQLGG